MGCDRRRATAAFAALVVLAGAGAASAHRLAPSLLDLRESASGDVAVLWKTSLLRPTGVALEPVLPRGCTAAGEPETLRDATSVSVRFPARCDRSLVGGEVSVRGLRESGTSALVRVALADGRRVRTVLHGGSAAWTIPARERPLRVAAAYAQLGALHIATGVDHLLLVLGLVLLASGTRALLLTLTAFTVGHSVTLALATLGLLRVPVSLAELGIAASVLWLAAEVAAPRPTSWVRRFPASVAFTCGLLHGLGFASALTAAGLPAGDVPLALVAFNAGVEIGQIGIVAAWLALAAALAAASLRLGRGARAVAAYAMGSVAALFVLQRAATLF